MRRRAFTCPLPSIFSASSQHLIHFPRPLQVEVGRRRVRPERQGDTTERRLSIGRQIEAGHGLGVRPNRVGVVASLKLRVAFDTHGFPVGQALVPRQLLYGLHGGLELGVEVRRGGRGRRRTYEPSGSRFFTSTSTPDAALVSLRLAMTFAYDIGEWRVDGVSEGLL